MNPITSRSGAARQVRNHLSVLPTARSRNIDEVNIRDIDIRRIRRTRRLVDVEIALIQHDRRVRVLDMDVFVGDVVHVSVADIRACPGLEPSAILPIEQGYVLDPRVADVVLDAGVLSNGAHRHSVCAVAPQIFNEDVGRVGLGRETVVADVDAGVCYC